MEPLDGRIVSGVATVYSSLFLGSEILHPRNSYYRFEGLII